MSHCTPFEGARQSDMDRWRPPRIKSGGATERPLLAPLTCYALASTKSSPIQSPSAFRTLHKAMPRRPLECGDFSPLSCFPGASGIHPRRSPKSGEKSPHSKKNERNERCQPPKLGKLGGVLLLRFCYLIQLWWLAPFASLRAGARLGLSDIDPRHHFTKMLRFFRLDQNRLVG